MQSLRKEDSQSSGLDCPLAAVGHNGEPLVQQLDGEDHTEIVILKSPYALDPNLY